MKMFGLPAQSTAVLFKFNSQLQMSIRRGLFSDWTNCWLSILQQCLGAWLIGQNPNQKGAAEIQYVFQNDSSSSEHFPVLVIKRTESKSDHESKSNNNDEDIMLNYKYHTVL